MHTVLAESFDDVGGGGLVGLLVLIFVIVFVVWLIVTFARKI